MVNYGDFLDRAHKLVPAGFVEEWWAMIVKKNFLEKGSQGIEGVEKVIKFPLKNRLGFDSALEYLQQKAQPLLAQAQSQGNSEIVTGAALPSTGDEAVN